MRGDEREQDDEPTTSELMHRQLPNHDGARLLHLPHRPRRLLALLEERVRLIIPHAVVGHVPLDTDVVLDTKRHAVQHAPRLALCVPLGRRARSLERELVLAVGGHPGVVVLAARGLVAGGAGEDGADDREGRGGAGLVGGVEVGGGVVAAGEVGGGRGGDGRLEGEDGGGLGVRVGSEGDDVGLEGRAGVCVLVTGGTGWGEGGERGEGRWRGRKWGGGVGAGE